MGICQKITKQKVFLETSFLKFPNSGIGNYLNIFLKGSENLREVEFINRDRVFKFFLLGFVTNLSRKIRFIRIIEDYFYRLFLLQFFLFFQKRNFLLIYPYHNIYLPFSKSKYITTIHDLVFLERPEYYSGFNLWINKNLLKWSINNNKAIIAVSLDTKKKIKKKLYETKSIHIIYNCYQKSLLDFKYEPLPNKNPFIFYFGGVDLRKDLTLMFRIYRLYKSKYGGNLDLVCTKRRDNYEQILDRQLIPSETIFLGDISEKELINYICNCQGVFYLSDYEGFGRPIMEASTFRKPIITKNLPSYQEIPDSNLLIISNEKEGIEKLQLIEKNRTQIQTRPQLNPKFTEDSSISNFQSIISNYIS